MRIQKVKISTIPKEIPPMTRRTPKCALLLLPPTTPRSIDTPRMWFLSIIFAIAGSSTNLFFSLRYPSVSLTPIIALLLVHPLGLLWDQLFKRHDDPEETFMNGCLLKSAYSSGTSQYKSSWKRRFRLWLAQGRWNSKEHCCVYVSSNVSFGFAFATDVSIAKLEIPADR
jgi:hypothetical protein